MVTAAFLGGCGAPGKLTDAQRDRLASQPILYVVNYVPVPKFAVSHEDFERARFLSRAVPGREPSRQWSAADWPDPTPARPQRTRGPVHPRSVASRAPSPPSGGLDDPALHIKESLAEALSAQLGVARLESVEVGSPYDAVEALRKRFRTGALLDVRTTRWGLEKGYVAYRARVRLIDLDAGKIVWIGECEWKPHGHVQRAPGFDDLWADDAHLLRAALWHAGESCAGSLRSSLLAAEYP